MGLKWIKYPKMYSINKMREIEKENLNDIDVFFEIKRDGSNISLMWDELRKKPLIYSRNGPIMDGKLKARFEIVLDDMFPALKEFWENIDSSVIVYGEFLWRGKSPAGYEILDTPQYLVFDVYSFALQDVLGEGFLRPDIKYRLLEQYDIPYIPPLAKEHITSYDQLVQLRDKYLAEALKQGYEGIVIKYIDIRKKYRLFKEKGEPKIVKKLRPKEKGIPQLPPLHQDEIISAIKDVYWEIGEEKFRDKSIALPIIAKRVREEAAKRNCSAPRNIYPYYMRFMELVKYFETHY